MKAANERKFIRILHLVFSVPILGYLYGPVASIPQAAHFTRWVAMPIVVLTGCWLWLKPRLLQWLRRQPRSGGGPNALQHVFTGWRRQPGKPATSFSARRLRR
jgi:hypothetical protein